MNPIVDKRRLDAAIQWLVNSIDEHEGNGSAAFFMPVKGWSPAYPETTGYLIPTMLSVGQQYPHQGLIKRAISCADWLCSIQLENGHFPAGVGGDLIPNIFDTGQILFGLTAAYEYTKCDHYYEAIDKACNRLLALLESDGSWQKDGFVPGHSPVYYSRVVWALLEANKILERPELQQKMEKTLGYYADQLNDNLSFTSWNFVPGEPAFTHTIAYTIRGFLECGILLNQPRYLSLAQKISDRIIELLREEKRFAGSYLPDWKGDYSFICVPGHFQTSIIFNRLYRLSKQKEYKLWAENLFLEARQTQSRIPLKGLKGGFPGSKPVWGKYQKFKWLNWGVKFYLEAAQSF